MALPSPVLIVCDNVPARQRTAAALSAHGCGAVEAADPDFALELLIKRQEIRAVVISAEQNSLLNGFDFAQVVVSHWPDIGHVIVVGSEPTSPRTPDGARYLSRPVDLDAMVTLLQGPGTSHPSLAS